VFAADGSTVSAALRRGGLARLGRAGGFPKGRARGPSRDRVVDKLKAAGLSNRAIAQRLGIDEKAVRKRAKARGWERDLTEKVRERVRAALVRSEVRSEVRVESAAC